MENYLYIWNCEITDCKKLHEKFAIRPNRYKTLEYRIEDSRNCNFETEEIYDFFVISGENQSQIDNKGFGVVQKLYEILKQSEKICSYESQLNEIPDEKNETTLSNKKFIYKSLQNAIKKQITNYGELKKIAIIASSGISNKDVTILDEKEEQNNVNLQNVEKQINEMQKREKNRGYVFDFFLALLFFIVGLLI